MADRGSDYNLFRGAVWTDYVRFFFEQNLRAAKHFKNFSADAAPGAEMITIPHVAEGPAPTSLVTTTGVITENVISDSATRLYINKWTSNALRFTDFQLAQIAAKYNLQAEYAKMLAYGISKAFDSCLLKQLNAGLITRAVTSSITSIQATDIRTALTVIDSYSVPQSECQMFIHSKHYWALMRNQNLWSANIYGVGAPLATGNVPSIFGIPVMLTNNIPDSAESSNMKPITIAHSRAVCYAFGNLTGQGNPRIQMLPKSSEGLYRKLVGDLMYGMKMLDSIAGCKINKNLANA